MIRRLRTSDRELLIGAVVVLLGGFLVLGTLTTFLPSMLDRKETQTIRATMANAQQLRKGLEVRIDGIAVGEVAKLEPARGGRATTVVMELDEEKTGPLYADASAAIRFRTVLGGALYVDLERGTPEAGPLADRTIPQERTSQQVEVDDITTVLKGKARRGLQRLPRELRDALADREAPARALDTLASVSGDLAGALEAVRGERPHRDLEEMVRQTARTVAALDRPVGELRTLVSGAASTLQVVAARGEDLRAALRSTPGMSERAGAALRRLDRTLAIAEPLVAQLDEVAPEVEPTVRTLRPVVTDADRLLRRAVPLLRSLDPAARLLDRAAGRAVPLITELEPSLERVDRVLLPALAEVDPETKKSTAVMIGGTFTGLGSGAAGQMDAHGHFMRFPATAGSAPLSTPPCQTYINNPDKEFLVGCERLMEALEAYFTWDPLGKVPGTRSPRPEERSGE